MSTDFATEQTGQLTVERPPWMRPRQPATYDQPPASDPEFVFHDTPAQPGETPERVDELEAAAEPGLWDQFNDLPSWAVSLGAHLLLLFALASITHIVGEPPEPPITSMLEEEIDPESYKFDTTVVDMVGSDSLLNTLTPSQDAAKHITQDPQKEVREQLNEELAPSPQQIANVVPQPAQSEYLDQVDLSGATDHPGGIEGAMDRLTFEIAGSLRERKTLVIWLFDASNSLIERRDAIANRFENVYRQLGQLDVATEDKALKTAVAWYGNEFGLLTPEPVDDVADVVDAVRNVPPDETGKEHVFAAVDALAAKWPQYLKAGTKTRRNVMMIVVTDERGDDVALMEDVIARVKRYGIKVYCVGNAAIFGKEKGYVTWTYDDGYSEELPVDQGPECVFPQRLQLPFWGGPSTRELERMSAGFGPYALTRLCAETGGLFLITAESQRGPKFDPFVMRNYQPDYRPFAVIQGDVRGNPAKRALVEAAELSMNESVPFPQTRFRADNDTILRQQITEAQKPFALFDYYLQRMMTILATGEKDRPKLKEPRWQASFDLAAGRLLAMRARTFGYNVVLADMKSSPKTFSTEGNNEWRLVSSPEISGGPQVRNLAKQATEYLSRVIDEHPGTPWAMLAERELAQPLGWEWKEGRINIPQVAANNNNNRTIQLAEDEQKKNNKPKTPAPPKRVRPNL